MSQLNKTNDMKKLNKNLHKAKKAKNDEFYTQLSDIEKELMYYKEHFKGKVVYCNCDDPFLSNFVKYFAYNFHFLGLKKLIASCYVSEDSPSDKAVSWEFNGEYRDNNPVLESAIITELDGDGDFRSSECIELLKEADIVVTNPPFSLFREYVVQLIKYRKDFLIIGNQNAIIYKEIFPLLKDNEMWLGVNTNKSNYFNIPDNYYSSKTVIVDSYGSRKVQVPAISWFTSLNNNREHEYINLKSKYSKDKYPKYDNYDAINVDKVVDIPCDYYGFMGVPITFMNKHNPKQFDVLGIMNTGEKNEGIRLPNTSHGRPIVNGVEKYLRVIIKRKM